MKKIILPFLGILILLSLASKALAQKAFFSKDTKGIIRIDFLDNFDEPREEIYFQSPKERRLRANGCGFLRFVIPTVNQQLQAHLVDNKKLLFDNFQIPVKPSISCVSTTGLVSNQEIFKDDTYIYITGLFPRSRTTIRYLGEIEDKPRKAKINRCGYVSVRLRDGYYPNTDKLTINNQEYQFDLYNNPIYGNRLRCYQGTTYVSVNSTPINGYSSLSGEDWLIQNNATFPHENDVIPVDGNTGVWGDVSNNNSGNGNGNVSKLPQGKTICIDKQEKAIYYL